MADYNEIRKGIFGDTPSATPSVTSDYNELRKQIFSDTPAQSSERTAIGTAKDVGVSALKGAVGLNEGVLGLADLATGGRVGRFANEHGFNPKLAHDELDKLYSPAQQQANQAVRSADGFFPKLGAIVQHPSVIPHSIIESAPSMLGGQVIGAGAMKLAPKLAPVAAGAIGEGAITAGSNAEQIRQQTNDGLLTPKQSAIAAGSGALTGAITGATGMAANKLGIGDVDTLFIPGARQAQQALPDKGIVRRTLEGGLVEGGQELGQSAQEQAASNLALDKDIGEGVGNAAALGFVTGVGMGAPMGALSRAASKANPNLAPRVETEETSLNPSGQAEQVNPTGVQSEQPAEQQAQPEQPIQSAANDIHNDTTGSNDAMVSTAGSQLEASGIDSTGDNQEDTSKRGEYVNNETERLLDLISKNDKSPSFGNSVLLKLAKLNGVDSSQYADPKVLLSDIASIHAERNKPQTANDVQYVSPVEDGKPIDSSKPESLENRIHDDTVITKVGNKSLEENEDQFIRRLMRNNRSHTYETAKEAFNKKLAQQQELDDNTARPETESTGTDNRNAIPSSNEIGNGVSVPEIRDTEYQAAVGTTTGEVNEEERLRESATANAGTVEREFGNADSIDTQSRTGILGSDDNEFNGSRTDRLPRGLSDGEQVRGRKDSDVAANELPSELKFNTPEYKVHPDADAIVRNRTKQGHDLRSYIDNRNKPTGLTESDLRTVNAWELPNFSENKNEPPIKQNSLDVEQSGQKQAVGQNNVATEKQVIDSVQQLNKPFINHEYLSEKGFSKNEIIDVARKAGTTNDLNGWARGRFGLNRVKDVDFNSFTKDGLPDDIITEEPDQEVAEIGNDTQEVTPEELPSEPEGPIKIGDTVTVIEKGGYGGKVTGVRNYKGKQYITTDESGKRSFSSDRVKLNEPGQVDEAQKVESVENKQGETDKVAYEHKPEITIKDIEDGDTITSTVDDKATPTSGEEQGSDTRTQSGVNDSSPKVELHKDEEKELSVMLKRLQKAELALQKTHPKTGVDYQHETRARATTRAANASKKAEIRNNEKKVLREKLREHLANGKDIPQQYLDAVGSSIDYDSNGKYSPIAKSEEPKTEQKQEPVQAESKPDEVSEQDLIDYGLLRQNRFNGKWQYKGFHNQNGFHTANSKERAIEFAREALSRWPESDRKTKAQQADEADREREADIDKRYSSKSVEELEKLVSQLEKKKDSLHRAGRREFNGGGRRTAAAVSAEGARDVAEEIRNIEDHIQRRKEKEPEQKETKLDNSNIETKTDKVDIETEETSLNPSGRDELNSIFKQLGRNSYKSASEELKSKIDNHPDAELIKQIQKHWSDVLLDVGYENKEDSNKPNSKVFIEC
jgi:hypothetical protein